MTDKFIARGRIYKNDKGSKLYGHYYNIEVVVKAADLKTAIAYVEFWGYGLSMLDHEFMLEGIGELRTTPSTNNLVVDVSDAYPVYKVKQTVDAQATVDALKNWLKGKGYDTNK